MEKLKLDLNALAVETFEAGPEKRREGTVRGNMGWTGYQSCEYCSDWQTCVYSCPPTCGNKPTCEETMCQETCLMPETCGCPSSFDC